MDTQDAYNKFYRLPKFSYNIIEYLLLNNEMIWKLLSDNSPNAWNIANLTKEQKGALIYKGEGDITTFKVFMDVGQDDAFTHETCVIRVSPYAIYPDNRTLGTVAMMLEVYSHYKINHLTNYTTRVDTIIQQFLQTLNGANIGGIGVLFFDRMGSTDNRMHGGGSIPYKGKWLIMSTKVG
jgi:hypothetical protein